MAALADHFYGAGIRLVVLAAPMFYAKERADLVAQIKAGPTLSVVTLKVSLEEAARRTKADPHPGRIATRDPAVLARHYSNIDWDRLPASDVIFETDGRTVAEVLASIRSRMTLTESSS